MDVSTWIELLPEGIFERICTFLAKGRACDDILHVVESCPSLHETAMHSVDYEIIVGGTSLANLRRWVTACRSSFREVSITTNFDEEAFGDELSKLQVTRCNIETTDQHALEVIKFLTTVSHLVIEVNRWPNVTFLFRAFSLLRLKKLEIHCYCDYEPWQYDDPSYYFDYADECIFYRKAVCGPEFNAFAVACPHLRVFETNICSCGTLLGKRSGFPFLEGFEGLEEYIVSGNVPIAFAARMPSITKVNISESEDAEDVHSFGTNLTRLWTYDEFSRAQIRSLETCVKLTELCIALDHGAEVSLPQLVACLPSLEKLGLRWDLPTSSNLGFSSAVPGVTLRTVRAAPQLTELYLEDVRLSLHELGEVLGTIGSRLRFFETTIVGQEENLVERWEAVVFLLVKHSPNLHYLYVDRNIVQEDSSTCKTRSQIRRLERAMSYLAEHLPVRTSASLQTMAEELGMDTSVLPVR